MAKAGSKLTESAVETAERIAELLTPLGAVEVKKMFGGCGLYEAGTMFALVDSGGTFYFRTTDANRADYEAAGSSRFGKMPYHRPPDEVQRDPAVLNGWAEKALAAARAAKSAKRAASRTKATPS